MAFSGYVTLDDKAATLLTLTDVTGFTLQSTRMGLVKIFGRAGAGAVDLAGPSIILADYSILIVGNIADLFPGIAATRVYAYGFGVKTDMMVSHA